MKKERTSRLRILLPGMMYINREANLLSGNVAERRLRITNAERFLLIRNSFIAGSCVIIFSYLQQNPPQTEGSLLTMFTLAIITATVGLDAALTRTTTNKILDNL